MATSPAGDRAHAYNLIVSGALLCVRLPLPHSTTGRAMRRVLADVRDVRKRDGAIIIPDETPTITEDDYLANLGDLWGRGWSIAGISLPYLSGMSPSASDATRRTPRGNPSSVSR